MQRPPLTRYVLGVIIVLSLVNIIIWLINNPEVKSILIFSSGFLLGMLAMYIAMHLYRWK